MILTCSKFGSHCAMCMMKNEDGYHMKFFKMKDQKISFLQEFAKVGGIQQGLETSSSKKRKNDIPVKSGILTKNEMELNEEEEEGISTLLSRRSLSDPLKRDPGKEVQWHFIDFSDTIGWKKIQQMPSTSSSQLTTAQNQICQCCGQDKKPDSIIHLSYVDENTESTGMDSRIVKCQYHSNASKTQIRIGLITCEPYQKCDNDLYDDDEPLSPSKENYLKPIPVNGLASKLSKNNNGHAVRYKKIDYGDDLILRNNTKR